MKNCHAFHRIGNNPTQLITMLVYGNKEQIAFTFCNTLRKGFQKNPNIFDMLPNP